MPMGSAKAGTGKAVPSRAFRFWTRKPLYLKVPSSPRLSASEEASAALAAQVPR